ncbi:MAG: hypothetical protein AAF363_21710 [Bacteroidota bacterium]
MSQIVSVFLTAYFVALPILFGLHSSEHVHLDKDHDHEGLALSEDVPECDLCDLFFSHSAILENPVSKIVVSIDSSDYEVCSDDLADRIIFLNHLRGPPTA